MDANSRDSVAVTQKPVQSCETHSYHVRHRFDGPAELSTTLSHALADVIGADATAARDQLGTVIDPNALDRLYDRAPRAHAGGYVCLEVWDHAITIYDDGQIVVSPPPRGSVPPHD